MGYFPLFLNLSQASVIVRGEGKITRDKLKILLSFGAEIRLFSLSGFEDMKHHPQICLVRRQLLPEDLFLHPLFIIVGDVDLEEKKYISSLAQNVHIPVNVVDVPELCTFYFPALITNHALTVAISTGGTCPSAAAYLKKQLEAQIPDQSGLILEWAQDLRIKLRTTLPENQRKQVLKKAIAAAFEKNRPLSEEEVNLLI